MPRYAAVLIVALALAALCPNPGSAQEKDRAAEVANDSAQIEALMDQSEVAIRTRVDEWQAQLDGEVEARVKGMTYPKNVMERIMGYNDSPVTEAVYGLMRKAVRQEDPAMLARLARAFTGFGSFSTNEAMRHMAVQLELSPAAKRKAFREKLCALGHEEPSLQAAAFELANFERYLGSTPAKPGSFTLDFLDNDSSGQEKPRGKPKPACD